MENEKNKPVAIILPCHNSGKHLAFAIGSILNNTNYPFKLILIESESTDGTAELCDRYARTTILPDSTCVGIEVYHTEKEGITKAINFGIAKAGDMDVYLTQDDVIIPKLYGRDWLTELVIGSKLEKCGIVTTLHAGGNCGQLYINKMLWVGTWSLFIPRETITKIGLFDENFSPGPGDDIDFSYRLHRAGLRIYIADFWVDHHRMTDNFYDHLEFLKMKNAGYFRRKHGLLPSWSEYEFDGEKYLLDDRTKKCYGCFKENGELEDPDTFKYIKELTTTFSDNDTILDVGANTGMMSLAVQHGKVLAYECTPETYDILKNNAVINEWKRIIPVKSAVYSKKIPYILGYSTLESHGKKVIWPGMNKIKVDENGTELTITLDDDSVIENVKLIKVDTEGCDLDVLIGAKNILKKYMPILITEHVNKDEKFLIDQDYEIIKQIGINSVWQKRNTNGNK